MTFVYIVRCNFTVPDREAAWNAWYSGPKIEQMLAQPYFRTCQRFRRAAGQGRNYLAMWVLSSPEALQTRQYRSQWGFADWQPYVADWSRDLFDGGAASEAAFAVAPGGALRAVSFDGASEPEARLQSEAIAAADRAVLWLSVAGLDRHTPMIGLRPLPDGAAAQPGASGTGLQDVLYKPISPLYTSRS
jgi:hypothetical protein